MTAAEDIPNPKRLGHRLIIQVLAERALRTPDHPIYSIPKTADPRDGYEDVSLSRFIRAIDRAAWWIETTIGKTLHNEAIAYIGPGDTRYPTLIHAANKAGWKVVLLSTRNSPEAQLSLLERTSSKYFLCAAQEEQKINKIVAAWERRPEGFKVIVVPEQSDLLADGDVPSYPYDVTYEEEKHKHTVVLHTSGTTGLPKPLYLPHTYYQIEDAASLVPAVEGRVLLHHQYWKRGTRTLQPMASFHIAGVLGQVFIATFQELTIVFIPPYVPITADIMHEVVLSANCQSLSTPPALLEAWVADPAKFETLKRLDGILFGSGPLANSVGTLVSRVNKGGFHVMGMSETGLPPIFALDDPESDWQYHHFHPWTGNTFEPIGADDLYELVVKKVDVPGLPYIQPCFSVFPGTEEFRTKDLFSRHPTKPYLWKFEGRNDDVIVFSTGEKMNPVTAESMILGGHKDITGAVVVGQARFQPGLMLELTKPLKEKEERVKFLEEIWPTIERANESVPAYGKITKGLVILTSPEKPFIRTPKLSVMRRRTIDLFADEIEDMFVQAEAQMDAFSNAKVHIEDPRSMDSVLAAARDAVRTIADASSDDLADKDDIFSSGVDSQGVLQLVRILNVALKNADPSPNPPRVQSRNIYENGSIASIAKVLYAALNSTETTTNGIAPSAAQQAADLLVNYSASLPKPQAPSSGPTTVVLTGSTGSLGTYILSMMLEASATYLKIYCLNRAADASARQVTSFTAHGLPTGSLLSAEKSSRLEFLHSVSLAEPDLGLSTSTYKTLSSSVTHIIHNAWPVNFNLPLSSFAPHIAGVRGLIDLAGAAGAALIYNSSISSAANYSATPHVPEAPIDDLNASSALGYGKSKHVSELLLQAASQAGFRTASLRLGQISGPSGATTSSGSKLGVWNRQEWFPSLVISSKAIGALPADIGAMNNVDWVPIDIVARSVLDLASESGTFNVVNPTVTSYSEDLLPRLAERLNLSIVPLTDWIEKVKAHGSDDLKANPAIKLADFFEGISAGAKPADLAARWDTGKACKASPALAGCGGISWDMLSRWVDGWEL